MAEQKERTGRELATFSMAGPNILGQRGEGRRLDAQLTSPFIAAIEDPAINSGERFSRCPKVLTVRVPTSPPPPLYHLISLPFPLPLHHNDF